MNEIVDGGPAFPSHGTMGEVVQEGMPMRDVFALAALEGLLAGHEPTPIWILIRGRSWLKKPEFVARMAYEYADAMLAERDKPTPAS